MNYILSESLVNTVALYIILKKLMTPFEEWKAFDLGIIDSEGNKIKDPRSAKEIECWDILTKFCWNFKKILSKFMGRSKLVTYLTASYLLKDSINLFYIEYNKNKLNELDNFSFSKQEVLFELCKNLPPVNEKITEENFEFLMLMYIEKINQQTKELDIKKVIC